MTKRPGLLPVIVGLVIWVTGCRPAEALPTIAAVAIAPPTPPVVFPSPSPAAPVFVATTPAPPPPTPAPTLETATPAITAVESILPTSTALPALPTRCPTPGRIEHGSLTTPLTILPLGYRVYLPPCYGADGLVYPVLYLFGGNVHDDAIWDELGMDEAAEAAIGEGHIPPLLIVMVDGGWLANNTSSGPASYEGFFQNELIPRIETAYCAWPAPEGRAVGGLSRGGYWSLMMAFRRPDLFRSVGGHSPALIDTFAGPAEDPTVTGVVNELGTLRIWIDLGERDPYLAQARPLHDALAADGVAHEWRINPGSHDYPYWQAHVAEYLAWYAGGFPADRAALPDCGARS